MGTEITVRTNTNPPQAVSAVNNTPASSIIVNTIAAPGKSYEFRSSGGYIQYRELGVGSWTNILPLSDITGPPGSGSVVIRTSALKQASTSASVADASKFIKLDGSLAAVDYSVNPATLAGYEIPVFCVTAQPNQVRVVPTSGTINGQPFVELFDNDSFLVYSDGTNLFIR